MALYAVSERSQARRRVPVVTLERASDSRACRQFAAPEFHRSEYDRSLDYLMCGCRFQR